MIGHKIAGTGILCIMVVLASCFWHAEIGRIESRNIKAFFGLILLVGLCAVVIGAFIAVWE